MSSKKREVKQIIPLPGRPGETGFGVKSNGKVVELEGADLEKARQALDKKERKKKMWDKIEK